MRKSSWIVIGVTVLILALGAFGLSRLVEWAPVEHRTGYSKEARHDRFLAGELLLRRLGYDARALEERQVFSRQPLQSTLLLESDEAFVDPGLRASLLDWVRRGGHLVLPLENTTDEKLLAALGIHVEGRLDAKPGHYSLPLENQRLRAQLLYAPVFTLDTEAQWSVKLLGHLGSDEDEDQKPRKKRKHGPLPVFTAQPSTAPGFGSPLADAAAEHAPPPRTDTPQTTASSPMRELLPDAADSEPGTPADAEADTAPDEADTDLGEPDTVAVYARYAYGKGRVTVGDFSLFTNNSIDEFDHAPLFVRLLTLPERRQPVVILFAPKYPGLFEWLAGHASEAWFAAAILLLAGLWRVIPRFGPLLPEAPPVRPGLGEHLAACGHFLLQRHAYEYLIMPLREDVLRALDEQRHLHPDITNLTLLAAHLSGMRPADIDRALAPEPDTQHEFLRRVQTLAALRTLCKRLRKPSSVSGALS